MPFDFTNADIIHDKKYDYTKVDYKNIDTKVIISCPLHGQFLQSPYKHINSGQGCPQCKSCTLADQRRMSVDEFKEKAISVHGVLYDYSKVVIVNAHTKVSIICHLHGEFQQKPNNHLYNKNGCPECGYNVSETGKAWLDSICTPSTLREHQLVINDRRFKTDGYDPETNTIYEYFGYFWHGCPDHTDHTKVNPRNKIPYKELYRKTLERLEIFNRNGFEIVSEWGK